MTVVFKLLLLCLSHTHGDNAEAMGEPQLRGRHVSLNPLILVTICLSNVSSATICLTASPSTGLGLSDRACLLLFVIMYKCVCESICTFCMWVGGRL